MALLKGREKREQVFELDKGKSVGTRHYNGHPYVTLKRKREGQPQFNMNLTTSEFEELQAHAIKIRAFVQVVNQGPKTNVACAVRDITLYKWLYTAPVTGELVREGPRWYINECECRVAGTEYQSHFDLAGNERAPELFVCSSDFALDGNAALVKQAYIYAIKDIVEKVKDTESCLQ